MAEVQKRIETVVTNFYRLDLSAEEAEVLMVVLAHVSGSSSGYRGVAQGVLDELKKALNMLAIDSPINDVADGGLRFPDRR